MQEEEAFPRGGSTGLSGLEYRELTQKARADALFESSTSGDDGRNGDRRRTGQKSRRSSISSSSRDQKQGGSSITASNKKKKRSLSSLATPVHTVRTLTFKRLSSGMALLGAVREISDLQLTLSLPNGLSGVVPLRSAHANLEARLASLAERAAASLDGGASESESGSEEEEEEEEEDEVPALADYFTIGQLLPCAVASTSSRGSRSHVELTLLPTAVNSSGSGGGGGSAGTSDDVVVAGTVLAAAIESVEDHGYVLDLGLGRRGFLRRAHAPTQCAGGAPLDIGTILTVVTLKQSGAGRALAVSALPSVVGTAQLGGSDSKSLSSPAARHKHNHNLDDVGLDSLRPGTCVQAVVTGVAGSGSGLSCTIAGALPADVCSSHLPAVYSSSAELEAAWSPSSESDAAAAATAAAAVEDSSTATKKTKKTGPRKMVVTARVLYVDPETKRAALSLRPQLIGAWKLEPSPGPPAGNAVTGCVVVRRDPGLGLLLRLPARPSSVDEEEEGGATTVAAAASSLYDAESESESESESEAEADTAPQKMNEGESESESESEEHGGREEGENSSSDAACYGYCHISRLADEHIEKLGRAYSLNTTHSARVLHYNTLDGLAELSLAPSALAMRYARYEQLSPGDACEGKIISLESFGMIVELSSRVKGLVPTMHLADVPLRHPEKRLKRGARVRCRVLKNEVVAGKRKLILTHKRTLVKSDLPVLTRLEEAKQGQTVHGYVSSVRESCLFISFYGNVVGRVSRGEMVEGAGAPPAHAGALFSAGQVVRARVLRADSEQGKLRLSLRSAEAAEAAQAARSAFKDVTPGTILTNIEVTAVLTDEGKKKKKKKNGQQHKSQGKKSSGSSVIIGLEVAPLGESAPDARAIIPAAHLTDAHALAVPLLSQYAVGDVLPRVLVLAATGSRIELTCKPLLLAAASESESALSAAEEGELPRTAAELIIEKPYVGYVRSTTSYGIFVGLLNGLSGLAMTRDLPAGAAGDPTTAYSIGQTVTAALTGEPDDDGKFNLSLAAALPSKMARVVEEATLRSWYADWTRCAKAAGGALASLTVGSVVSVRVEQVKPYGLVVSGVFNDDSFEGFVAVEHARVTANGEERSSSEEEGGSDMPEVGTEVSARVLDVDVEKKIVDLTLQPELVKAGSSSRNSSSKSPKKGSNVSARVILIKADRAVLVLSRNRLAIVLARALSDAPDAAFERLRYGAKGKVRVVDDVVGGGGKQHLILAADFVPEEPLAPPKPEVKPTAVERQAQKEAERAARKAQRKAEKVEKREAADVAPGTLLNGVVSAVLDTQLNIDFPGGIKGRVHIAEVLDDSAAKEAVVSGGVNPLAVYAKGQTVRVCALGVHDSKTHSYLAITHARGRAVLECSLRPSMVEGREHATEDKQELMYTPLALTDLTVAQSLTGFVQEVQTDALWVCVGPHLRGRVHALYASPDVSVVRDLAAHFKAGTPVHCQVLAVDAKKGRLDLTLNANVPVPTSAPPLPGTVLVARVAAVKPTQLRLQVGPHSYGNVHITDLADRYSRKGTAAYDVGDFVCCSVLQPQEGTPEYSAAAAVEKAAEALKKAQVAAAAKKRRSSSSSANSKVAAAAKAKEEANAKAAQRLQLTLRTSDVHGTGDPRNPRLVWSDLKSDGVYTGYITHCGDRGAFVTLGLGLTARVLIANLSDEFIKDFAASFPPGKLVKGRVLALDHAAKRIDLTLKASAVDPAHHAEPLKLSDLRQGQKLPGVVKRVESFGVFVTLAGSRITGMCHVSEASDEFVELKTSFAAGDLVKVVVLGVEAERKRLSLGMKPSYFEADEVEEAMYDVTSADGASASAAAVLDAASESGSGSESSGSEEESVSETSGEASSSSSSEEEGEEEEEEEEANGIEIGLQDASDRKRKRYGAADASSALSTATTSSSAAATTGLKVASGLLWGAEDTAGEQTAARSSGESESEDEAAGGDTDGNGVEPRPSKRAKRAAKKREEASIAQAELDSLSASSGAQSADDFERMLLARPQSSYLWIQYAAFHLQLMDVDRARAVCDRALAKISLREEAERMNVFVARLNLENAYGTDESVERIFKDAVQRNDSQRMHQHMAAIYERSGKVARADAVHKACCKKHGADPAPWIARGRFKYRQDQAADARQVLQRSLLSLPKREHIGIITKFGIMEFKNGDIERGRTIFENIISNYPKRVDLWSVYLDQELRTGDHAVTRALFDRVLECNFSSKKSKFFFKRALEFEKLHGDASTIQSVKDRALAYVNARA